MGRAIACCSFQNLRTLLALLPGTRASLLRESMATPSVASSQDPVDRFQVGEAIDTNTVADHVLGEPISVPLAPAAENVHPSATTMRRPDMSDDRDVNGLSDPDQEEAMSVSQELAQNPVLRNPLMQLTVADFQSCRITPDGLISVIDAIRLVKECTGEANTM